MTESAAYLEGQAAARATPSRRQRRAGGTVPTNPHMTGTQEAHDWEHGYKTERELLHLKAVSLYNGWRSGSAR